MVSRLFSEDVAHRREAGGNAFICTTRNATWQERARTGCPAKALPPVQRAHRLWPQLRKRRRQNQPDPLRRDRGGDLRAGRTQSLGKSHRNGQRGLNTPWLNTSAGIRLCHRQGPGAPRHRPRSGKAAGAAAAPRSGQRGDSSAPRRDARGDTARPAPRVPCPAPRVPHLADDQLVELAAAVGDEHGGSGGAHRPPASKWAPKRRLFPLVRPSRRAGQWKSGTPTIAQRIGRDFPTLFRSSPMGSGEGSRDACGWPIPRAGQPGAGRWLLMPRLPSFPRADRLLRPSGERAEGAAPAAGAPSGERGPSRPIPSPFRRFPCGAGALPRCASAMVSPGKAAGGRLGPALPRRGPPCGVAAAREAAGAPSRGRR